MQPRCLPPPTLLRPAGALLAAKRRAATDLNTSNSTLMNMLADSCSIFVTVSIAHAQASASPS
jgi:hypothetical protein